MCSVYYLDVNYSVNTCHVVTVVLEASKDDPVLSPKRCVIYYVLKHNRLHNVSGTGLGL